MCGIIGAFHQKNKDNVNQEVVDIFEEQCDRGMKGFGVVGINGHSKPVILRSTEPAKFMFDLHKKGYNMMLVHHRTPTSTPNYLQQTHPILVSHEELKSDFLIVHNGIISNDIELEETHYKLGYGYTTYYQESESKYKFNDSESLAIEVARFIESKSKEIGTLGSAAFIALEMDKETEKVIQVHFGRNDRNPLNLAATKGRILLSSEGKGSEVKPFMLYSFEPKGDMKLKKRKMPFKKPAAITNSYLSGDYSWNETKSCYTKIDNDKWEEPEAEIGYKNTEKQIAGFKTGDEIEEADTFLNLIDNEITTNLIADVTSEIEDFCTDLSSIEFFDYIEPKVYTDKIKTMMEEAKIKAIEAYEDYEIAQYNKTFETKEADKKPLPING